MVVPRRNHLRISEQNRVGHRLFNVTHVTIIFLRWLVR